MWLQIVAEEMCATAKDCTGRAQDIISISICLCTYDVILWCVKKKHKSRLKVCSKSHVCVSILQCSTLCTVHLSQIAHFAHLYTQNMKLRVKTEVSDLERTFRF